MSNNLRQVSLAAATWRRDFQRDEALQRQVHQSLTDSLHGDLDSAASVFATQLHPSQRFKVSHDHLAVSITEPSSVLLVCYINVVAAAGEISLQFDTSDGKHIAQEKLRLDRIDKNEYVWESSSVSIDASELAAHIFERLLHHALTVVQQQTPNRQRKSFVL